ncbi:MAG: ribosome maturation factor RimP [Solobacterium sp.]|nr:ribosome maturation factor RimP [Solobacterium sp.]
MEQIAALKEQILPVLNSCGVNLYELKWISNEHTLQISIMRPDGSMDLDTCASVSEQLSDVLDNTDLIPGAYTLEVCSPGAEREVKDIHELKQMEQPYIYVRLKHPVKKMTEITGQVESYEGSTIMISYRDKAATRTAEFDETEAEFVRLAVRI